MLNALLLGALQGITEWLPVSSQGVVSAAYAFLEDRPLGEAVAFAGWLHVGTALAAVIALRRQVWSLVERFFRSPREAGRLFWFLVTSTLVSGAIGLSLLLLVFEMPVAGGAVAMLVVGGFMLVTATVLTRIRVRGTRTADDLTMADAVLAGVGQGLAALPGISRSALTVGALLGRGVGRTDALVVSFLMSIPASLGVALLGGLRSQLLFTSEGLFAAAVSAIVGLVTIQALLALARRVNFAAFVFALALVVIAGGVFLLRR